jgi:hypothetical protein
MSSPAEPLPPLPVSQCTVCGTDVETDTARCPSCGLTRPAARGSQVLGRSGFWMLGLVLLVLYVTVLVIVVTAH